MKTENPISNITDTFFSKLKEQSFTILIMAGVIWYQGKMMEERVAYWQKLYEDQKAYIEQTVKEDKAIMLNRINYLQDQRDKYCEAAIDELKIK